MTPQCNYIGPLGNTNCTRPKWAGHDQCFFHFVNNARDAEIERYKLALEELVKKGDGNWCGFVFPRRLMLEAIEAACPINLNDADIGALTIKSCKFNDDFLINTAKISGPLSIEACTFEKEVQCNETEIRDQLLWTSTVTGAATFTSTRFGGPVRFFGQFNGKASWAGSTFSDSAEFRGGWIAYMSAGGPPPEKPFVGHGLFGNESSLQYIDFRRPERTRFVKVDFRKARMTGTDFRGVGFHDITWPTMGRRRAIYDEIWDQQTRDLHAPMVAEIEAAYRSIRVCIEEAKDFSTASDFYFGEMEARRKQMSWYRRYGLSIETIYRYLSGYGCQPARALLVLFALIILHALLAGSLLYGAGLHLPEPHLALISFERTLSLLSPMHVETARTPLPGWYFLVDAAFAVIAVVQTALFALSLRGRIKRG